MCLPVVRDIDSMAGRQKGACQHSLALALFFFRLLSCRTLPCDLGVVLKHFMTTSDCLSYFEFVFHDDLINGLNYQT